MNQLYYQSIKVELVKCSELGIRPVFPCKLPFEIRELFMSNEDSATQSTPVKN